MSPLAYLRSLIVVLILFPVMTVTLSAFIVLNSILRGPDRLTNWIPWFWGQATCTLFGVKLEITGLEHLPKSGYLVLFNHRSFFDIFALQTAIPDLRFGAKIELFKIPVFGAAMKKAGVLPIARGNVQEVIRVYEKAHSKIRQGQIYGLAPEGLRNTTDKKLLPFKSGPFLFAMGAGATIVPCVIWGSSEVWPKGALVPQTHQWSSKMKLQFFPAMSMKDHNLAEKSIIQDQVYSVMASALDSDVH